MKPIAIFLGLSFLVSLSATADDPSDLWYRGYLKTEAANEMIESDRLLEGLDHLTEAFALFKTLALEHPDFQPEIVRARLQMTAEKRSELKSAIRSSKASGIEIEKLERQLEELKQQLKELRERKKEVDQELYRVRGGFDLGAAPLIEMPEGVRSRG